MRSLKIAQINVRDRYGGAEKIALSLHKGFQRYKHNSLLFVGSKHTQEDNVIKITSQTSRFSVANSFSLPKFKNKKINFLLHNPSLLVNKLRERVTGSQLSKHRSTQYLSKNNLHHSDIVNIHNLHGHYFDLSILPSISKQIPTVMTLHDMWALTGFCIYSLDCEKWMNGCGDCPQVQDKKFFNDGSKQDWERKKAIYENSKLYIVTPSKWLMDKVQRSILQPGIIHSKVIPNGIDLNIFYPKPEIELRRKLEISSETKVILFAATAIRKSKFKGYSLLLDTIKLLSQQNSQQNIVFLALGEDGVTEQISSNIRIQFVKYQTSEAEVARYYCIADIYLHLAKAEVFGLTITEAMACKTPVIATNIGGIPEQIIDGENGYLVPMDDPQAIVDKISSLIMDQDTAKNFKEKSYQRVQNKFSTTTMINNYLDFYDEILSSQSS